MPKEKLFESLFRGLSGCKLTISNNGEIVTKTSASIKYNERLVKQIKKQKEFHCLHISNIKCPRVLEQGIDENLLEYFTMEYAEGKTYDYFLNYSSPSEISFFIDSLLSYFDSVKNTDAKYTDDEFSRICTAKIKSIRGHIPNSDFLKYLENRILLCKNVDVPLSFCHGDLTLPNILFGNSELFFLDFLDSYLESWVLDLVKLKQDLFYLWCIGREKKSPNVRSIQVSIKIWEEIEKKYYEKTKSEEFKILEALNFLRIYPYLKNESDFLLINKILEKLPIYEEFNNTNGRQIFKIS